MCVPTAHLWDPCTLLMQDSDRYSLQMQACPSTPAMMKSVSLRSNSSEQASPAQQLLLSRGNLEPHRVLAALSAPQQPLAQPH